MKKIIFTCAFFTMIILGGCSSLEEVNQSLEYVNEVTEYINTVSDFAGEAPQLIEEASSNAEAKEELEDQLTALRQEVEAFNQIEAPPIAEDIHQQLVDKNEALIDEIDQAMANGEVLMDQLENTELFTTIDQMTTLLNQLEELGL